MKYEAEKQDKTSKEKSQFEGKKGQADRSDSEDEAAIKGEGQVDKERRASLRRKRRQTQSQPAAAIAEDGGSGVRSQSQQRSELFSRTAE